jgi:protein-S-isoprenylcysteine O-methyltransferase Ste14
MFALTWLAAAAYNRRHTPKVSRRAIRGFPWALIVVLVLLLFFLRDIPHSGWRALTVHSVWAYALGLALLLISTAFTLWARAVLGTMWTLSPVLKEGHALRTDGPYAITRHPIYTGMLGMMIGTVLLPRLGSWLVVLALFFVFVEGKIQAEERLLIEAFPGRYEQYRRRVPRLVPGAKWLRRSSRSHEDESR